MSGRRSPAWLPCPLCESEETVLVRRRTGPRRYAEAGVVLRGHECLRCHHRYVSAQRVIDMDELRDVAIEVAA